MNRKIDKAKLTQLLGIYDEVELTILLDWLGIARPPALAEIELELHDAADDGDELSGRVRLMKSCYEWQGNEDALANAVSRLVLSEIQDRLPQWGVGREDGTVQLARFYSPRRRANVDLLPRFLFEINWADSGPGFSWPESYHVAYLPGFDRYVVTASQDSPDVHGYTDEAIGYFSAEEAVEQGVHRVITAWWKEQVASREQHRWAYLFGAGNVDASTAEAWADEVWDAETGEPLSCCV